MRIIPINKKNIYIKALFVTILFLHPGLNLAADQHTNNVDETLLLKNTTRQDVPANHTVVGTTDKNGSINSVWLSLDEIAKELSNPVTALASIRTAMEYRIYQGDLPAADDQSNIVFLIKPSVPIPLKNGKNILMRASIPVYVDLPVWKVPFGHPLWIQDYDYPDFRLRQSSQITAETGEFVSVHGHVGDLGFDIAYGGVSDNGFISMYGIAAVLNTSTNISASRNQWLLGPEIAFGKSTDWGVFGAWVTHLTNISDGDLGGKLTDTNETYVEVFFAYGLKNGWQIFSNPKISYDWEADSGNELLLPIGAGLSKTTRVGKIPLKIAFEIQNFVASPDRFGTQWLFTLSITPVITNPFQK